MPVFQSSKLKIYINTVVRIVYNIIFGSIIWAVISAGMLASRAKGRMKVKIFCIDSLNMPLGYLAIWLKFQIKTPKVSFLLTQKAKLAIIDSSE